MAQEHEIAQKVIEMAAEHGGVSASEVTRETHFINDLNYDSLELMEFVMDLEDEFEVQVPDDVADKVKTVGEAIDYTIERLKVAGPA